MNFECIEKPSDKAHNADSTLNRRCFACSMLSRRCVPAAFFLPIEKDSDFCLSTAFGTKFYLRYLILKFLKIQMNAIFQIILVIRKHYQK